jgi:superfamily II DNA or RNA helicase
MLENILVKDKKNHNTILSRRGYSISKDFLSEKELKNIKKELTVTPIAQLNYGPSPPSFKVYKESKKRLYVPKSYGQQKFGTPELDKMKNLNVENIDIDFKGSMREKQLPVIETFLKECDNSGGGIVCLPCGFGKTVIGLNILSKLKKKTLVVCHKEFLLNQWKERIEMFIPDAKLGSIQQKKVDIENKDIVLGMLQSIAMRDYPEDTFDSFGFIIFDECHHLGAEVFSRALPKLTTTYMLGLSATPDRKDGLSKVFEYYLGNMVYCVKEREPDTVSLKIIKYYSENEKYCDPEINFRGQLNSPAMITKVCSYNHRTEVFISEIEKLVKLGRRILVLSERRDHLSYFHKQLTERKICDSGYYVGGMKQEDLNESAKKKVVLGTFHLASEGMDVPELNTVILASPKSDIQQSIGRIFRQKAEDREHQPLIIDLIDENIPSFKRKFTQRNRIYRKNKFNVTKEEVYEKQNIIKISDHFKEEIKLKECIIED